MPDFTKLLATRDGLNKHIDSLVASSVPDQVTVDNLTAEATVLDNDVVAATPAAPGLNFTAFNASLQKLNADAALFVADANVTQVSIDGLQQGIDGLDAQVVAATV